MTTPRIATPAGGTEIVSDRVLKGKLFNMGGQARRLIHRVGPVHIPDDVDAYDAAGSFNWLDPNLQFNRGGGVYSIRAAWFDLEITDAAPLTIRFINRRTAGGSIDLELEEAGASGLPTLNFSDITVSGNRVTFADLISGMDFVVECRLRRLKTETILKDATAPKRFVWKVLSDDVYSQATVAQTIFGSDNKDDAACRQSSGKNRRRRLADLTRVSVDGGREGGRRVTRYTDEWDNGETLFRDPVTRILETRESSETVYPVMIDPTVNESITDGEDDGMTYGAGWDALYSTTGNFIQAYGSPSLLGFRFQAVALPEDATINDPTELIFERSNLANSGASAPLHGDAVADAPAWGPGELPADMTDTTASVTFAGTANGELRLDVKDIVEDIIDAGFLENNDMRFGTVSAASGDGFVYVDDYTADSPNDEEAILEINFTEAVPPVAALADSFDNVVQRRPIKITSF